MTQPFPFSAIVGQEDMKLAMILTAVDPGIGGVLVFSGGGTPLAAGLHQAMVLGLQARARGMTPVTVLITDGKSYVALDGSPDRTRAREDAVRMARAMRVKGLDVPVIDMSPRPQPALRDLAQHLDGGYLALPRADAARCFPCWPRIAGFWPRFEGMAGVLFPVMAKMLAAVPFMARLFSGTSSRPDRVRALIDSTGSRIDAEGLDLCRQLVVREAHVAGTLSMLAQWELDDLLAARPGISARTLFITGVNDQTVPPRVAATAADRMPHAQVVVLDGYGHLIHEEAPDEIAHICGDFITRK